VEFDEKPTMKTVLLATLLFGSAAAFGQAGALSNQAVPLTMPDHPQHASYTSMASETSIIGGSPNTYSYAQGERPLWEFGPIAPPPTPLGDVARAFRKEKVTAKKAEIVLEKQGS
jgi:hypothetical protein